MRLPPGPMRVPATLELAEARMVGGVEERSRALETALAEMAVN